MPLARGPNYGASKYLSLQEAAMPADVTKTPVSAAITTPSRVETGIGALEFTGGYPTRETAEKLRDTWITCTGSRRS